MEVADSVSVANHASCDVVKIVKLGTAVELEATFLIEWETCRDRAWKWKWEQLLTAWVPVTGAIRRYLWDLRTKRCFQLAIAF
jgi:hypothetical protein